MGCRILAPGGYGGVQEWSEPFHTYIAEPLTRAAPVETLGFSASTFAVTVPAAVLSWLELKETEKSKTGESQRHLHTHTHHVTHELYTRSLANLKS